MLRVGGSSGAGTIITGLRSRALIIGSPIQRSQLRSFADVTKSSTPPKASSLKSSGSASPAKVSPPSGTNSLPKDRPTPAAPSSTVLKTEKTPLVPPPPGKVQTAPPTKLPSTSTPAPSPPSTPPPPVPRKRFRAFRFLLYLALASGASYAGAVFYALKSDNFHDFFTEYVPLGEESVLYFEERAFHKRFPNARINQNRSAPSAQRDGSQVTIPSRSGISWRLSEQNDAGNSLEQKGRHMSALDDKAIAEVKAPKVSLPQKKDESVQKPEVAKVERKETPAKAPPVPDATKQKEQSPPPIPQKASQSTPKVDQGPRTPAIKPITHVSPVEMPNADEPLVQDLAKIINDIITVVNADSADASNRYASALTKAKESLASMGPRINALKEKERQAADEKIREAHGQFDESAMELAKRIDAARNEEAAQFREEFESERERLSRGYADKLKTEVERAQKLSDQRIQNELSEQAVAIKRKFVGEIQELVESERDGRLSKISELSSSVDKLQKLTSDWNGVIDSNLSTQKLQVAVEAVRSAISRGTPRDGRSKAFLNELAALKEIANGDGIVDAAVASINPTAYQRGIPSTAQLIDRFRGVSAQVRTASSLPEDAGIAAHAASWLLSKITFQQAGSLSGGDVDSVLARTESLLEEGDLDSAAREMNGLEGWAKALSKDWLQECRRVLEVQQALDVIETEARLQCLRLE